MLFHSYWFQSISSVNIFRFFLCRANNCPYCCRENAGKIKLFLIFDEEDGDDDYDDDDDEHHADENENEKKNQDVTSKSGTWTISAA